MKSLYGLGDFLQDVSILSASFSEKYLLRFFLMRVLFFRPPTERLGFRECHAEDNTLHYAVLCVKWRKRDLDSSREATRETKLDQFSRTEEGASTTLERNTNTCMKINIG